MIKNPIKFCYKLRSQKTISAKITSSKQQKLTKTTFVNFEKKNFRLKL